MSYIVRTVFHKVVFSKLSACRKLSSDSIDDGFTRSIYCKPLMKEVIRDGKPKKIMTGLVDGSNEPFCDQITRFQLNISYKHNLDLHQLYKWLQNRSKERNRLRQIVSADSIQHLGLDLAVAHMLCRIGGRVQFAGMNEWFFQYAGLPARLPKTYVGELRIHSVDLSGTNVVYEGFEHLREDSKILRGGQPLSWSKNVKNLTINLDRFGACRLPGWGPNDHDRAWLCTLRDMAKNRSHWRSCHLLSADLTELKHLRLKRCVHVDDSCLSRVGRIETLQLLDVSECPRLTSKGLATLTQLKQLRKLLVNGNPDIEDKELVCLLLEEHLPKLYISGVDYIGQLPDGSRKKILSLVAGNSDNNHSSLQLESGSSAESETHGDSSKESQHKSRAMV